MELLCGTTQVSRWVHLMVLEVINIILKDLYALSRKILLLFFHFIPVDLICSSPIHFIFFFFFFLFFCFVWKISNCLCACLRQMVASQLVNELFLYYSVLFFGSIYLCLDGCASNRSFIFKDKHFLIKMIFSRQLNILCCMWGDFRIVGEMSSYINRIYWSLVSLVVS